MYTPKLNAIGTLVAESDDLIRSAVASKDPIHEAQYLNRAYDKLENATELLRSLTSDPLPSVKEKP